MGIKGSTAFKISNTDIQNMTSPSERAALPFLCINILTVLRIYQRPAYIMFM
jgi:hypothetical protein